MKQWTFTIKTAAPALYRAERQVADSNTDQEFARKFFNFIVHKTNAPDTKDKIAKPGKAKETINYEKSPIASLVPLYHGTNGLVPAKIPDTGLATIPDATKIIQREGHASNQFQFFASRTVGGTSSYQHSKEDADPIVMNLRVPLYALNEVRAAIFNPFLRHPYVYNEDKYHFKLAKMIQPALKKLKEDIASSKLSGKSRDELKTMEKDGFAKILSDVHEFIANGTHDEWTIVNGVQERFIDDVTFKGAGVLGKSSYKQVLEAYKTDPNFKQKFIESLKTSPYNYWMLSFHKDWAEKDENGRIKRDPKTHKPIYNDPLEEKLTLKKLKDGKPILDQNGNPVMETITVRDIVRQGWADWVMQNPTTRINWLPEQFLHDESPINVCEYSGSSWNTLQKNVDPKTGLPIMKKMSFSNWFQKSFVKIYANTFSGIKDWPTFREVIGNGTIPVLVQIELAPQVRAALLRAISNPEMSESMRENICSYFPYIHPYIFKDPAFVDQLNEKIFSQLKPEFLWRMFKWSYPTSVDSHADTDKFRPVLTNNPSVFKTYISKVPPNTVVWNRWKPEFLKEMAPLIKERIRQSIATDGLQSILNFQNDYGTQNYDDTILPSAKFSGEYEWGTGLSSLPKFLLDDDILKGIADKAIESANTNFTDFMQRFYNALPEHMRNMEAINNVILNKLQTETVPWNIWELCPSAITEKPELQEKKNTAKVMAKPIDELDWSQMTTDDLKKAFINKAKEHLTFPTGWSYWQNLPEELVKQPEMLKSIVTGYTKALGSYYYAPGPFPPKLYEMPEFAPFKEQLHEAQINSDVLAIDYSTLGQNLKAKYIEALYNKAAEKPNQVLSKLEQIKQSEPPENAQIALEAEQKIWPQIAYGLGSIVASQEQNYPSSINFSDDFTGSDIAKNPNFIKNRIEFYKAILNGSCISLVNYNELPPEYKETYHYNARERLRHNPSWLLKIKDFPEAMKNSQVISGLAEGYRRKYAYDGAEVPEELLQALQPYKAEINQRLLDYGTLKGLFIDALTPEQKQSYRDNIINEVMVYPESYANIDPTLKSDPAFINAALSGFEARFANPSPSYITMPNASKELPDELLQMANSNGDEMAKKKLENIDAKMDQYWVNATKQYKMGTVLAKIPPKRIRGEFLNIFRAKFENGSILKEMTDSYGYALSAQSQAERLKTLLSREGIPEEIKAEFLPKVQEAAHKAKIQYYVDNPYELSNLPPEEKQPYISAVFEGMKAKLQKQIADVKETKNGINLYYVLQYITSSRSAFGEESAEAKQMRQMVVDAAKDFIATTDNPLEIKNAKYYMKAFESDPEIAALAKDDPNIEIKIIDFYLKNGHLSSASDTVKSLLKKNPKDETLLALKQKCVDAYVQKINEMSNSYHKDSWCSQAKAYWGGMNKKIRMACDPEYAAQAKAEEDAKAQEKALKKQKKQTPIAPTETAVPVATPAAPIAEAPATTDVPAPSPQVAPKAPAKVMPKKPGKGLKDKSDSFKSLFSIKPFFDLKNGNI